MIEDLIVQLNVYSSKRDEALLKISEIAFEHEIIKDKKDIKKLLKEFIKREEIATTAFEDGFAIPHARIKEITKPAIIITRFQNEVDWPSINNENTKIAICLLIPENQASSLHMDVLAKIATLLLDKDFRNNLKTLQNENDIKNYVINKINQKDKKALNKINDSNRNKKDIFIVGVSACATGVAHTYMAKEALEKAGEELGWKVKIETQGQKGQEYKLTEEEIDQADAIVFATDIYVDPERFIGKKFLNVKTNDAIHDPIVVLKKSLEQEVKTSLNSSKATKESNEFKNSKVKTFMGHLLSGVSRMIPFVVFSGIIWAIFNSILRTNPGLENNEAFAIAKNISEIGFTVFIAIMGGFIAESIAGRAGFAVGFITTFAASNSSFYFWWNINGLTGIPQIKSFFTDVDDISNVGLSLFAAILMGFASGYLVKWVNTWKTHKLITPIMPIIFIPVVCSSIIIFPFIFLLSGPLGYLMNGLVFGISKAGKISGLNFVIGCLLGAMIGFDMGGPINKIAGTTATALIPIDPRLMGAVAAAIPIAPIGCGFATLVARKLFTDKEKAEGITALGLGFFGISEGAIPFAMNRPKKVLIANVIGSAVAGGLAFLFFVGGYVGMWGGPITALVLGVKAPITELSKLGTSIPLIFGGGVGGTEFLSILWFFVAIIGGVAVHSTIFVFLIKLDDHKMKEKYLSKIKKIFVFRKAH